MHIMGIRKFCCIYQIVKEVDFCQLKRSYNPFKGEPAHCKDFFGPAEPGGRLPETGTESRSLLLGGVMGSDAAGQTMSPQVSEVHYEPED